MLQHLPHTLHHSLLPALKSFPSTAPTTFSLADLKQWYSSTSTDPLHPALLACTGWSALVWILGEVTGNVSQVDRLWTTLPLFYSAHFTFYPYFTGIVSSVKDLDPRMLLVFGLQCCWSARLTYQSARRGFLDPRSEDYRWPIVRRALPPLAFKLLNLVFISLGQNVLLLAAELPQYLLLTHYLSTSTHVSALARLKPYHAPVEGGQVPLNVADVVLAGAFLVTLTIEMRADNEQQRFQKLKRGAVEKQRKGVGLTKEEQKAVERGFVAEGLWSWSRHPNFACEQTTWYLLYAFTVLPFLPLTQSLTSHPLSTLSSFLHPSTLPTLFGHSKSLFNYLSAHLPSVDEFLTSLEHPLTFTRQHLRSLLSDPGAYLSSLPALKLSVLRASRLALAELKADEGVYWNYSIVAPLAMSALFVASTELTERITGGKYPLYKPYRHRVAKFWPVTTPLKGAWLALTGGRRGGVDRRIWGKEGGEGEGEKGKRE